VDVCLPTHLHKDAVLLAAQYGSHVICEKPIAIDLDTAVSMVTACKHAKIQLYMAHCIRFWPQYHYLATLVAEKLLGDFCGLSLYRYGARPNWSSNNWLFDEALSGGAALDMHIHDTDFVVSFLGSPNSIVSSGIRDETGLRTIQSIFHYDSMSAQIEGGWLTGDEVPFSMGYRAQFELGTITFDGKAVVLYRNGQAPFEPIFESYPLEAGGNVTDLGGYLPMLQHFLECARNHTASEIVTTDSVLSSLATCLKEIDGATTSTTKIRALHA